MLKNLRFSNQLFSQKARVSTQSQHRIGRSLIAFLLLMPMLLFSHSAVQAADGEPTLSIDTTTVDVMNGTTVSVPVSFADAATTNNISALSFSLDFDQTCLTFDNITDTNADGIPDAVTGLPVGYVSTVSFNAADTTGEIDVTVKDQANPQDALDDGVLATFTFNIKTECRTTDGSKPTAVFAFGLPIPTFGNVGGTAVAGGTHTDGTYTLRFNANPTDIAISADTVDENVALGTTVGTLSSTDADADLSQTHSYSLVDGDGTNDVDNASFTIVNDALKTNIALNYEDQTTYAIMLRTTDNLGGTFDKAFTIDVTNVNEAPTSLTINTSSVDENSASGTTIGTFSSADVDAADASVDKNYSFTSGGVGALDNASFSISGSLLKTSAALNYEVKKIYNVHVLVTDIGGLSFDNIFTIRVNDANDAPVAVNDTIAAAVEVVSAPKTISVLANDTDEDTILAHTLKVVPASVVNLTADSGSAVANNSDTSVLYTPAAGFNGPVSFSYKSNDGAVNSVDSAAVTFQVVANDARGDCNADTKVNAGDFPAFVLELADTDTPGGWYNTYTGSYHGSPMGCDANADKAVSISDLTCAVLVSFNNFACTTAQAQAANTLADAELTVGQNLVGVRNSMVNVPVRLTTNGQSVAAASFALSFDKDQLAFDATDADQNGLPDAVTFNTPRGMITVANYNEAAGRLELTVYAVTLPMPMLTDGLVANVALKVNAQTNMAETPITLVQSSLGSDQGQAVPVQVNDGSVQIAQNYSLFLPIMLR